MHKVMQSGFTLVELMVVVVVVLVVAAAMVTLNFSAASGHVLESAAERLAIYLEEARWQAIATGRRVAWEAPDADATQNKTQQAQWYEQTQDGVWHVRLWASAGSPLAGVVIRVAQPFPANGAPARLMLGPEPVGMAACILLTQASSTIAVVSDGFAPFTVRRDAHC